MNIKNLIYIITGLITFLGIWLFSMFAGVTLLIGFGFGILLYSWINNLFKKYQRNIYLNEKAGMAHRKLELEKELEKIESEK
jgi:hypothetical protein